MKRLLPACAVAVSTAALAVGGALAYWTATGHGSGTASDGTLQAVTVVAVVGGEAPTSFLLPGGAAADVVLRINNPNTYAVTLVSVTGSGTITPDGGHPTCTTTGVTFTDQTGLSINVPPGKSLADLPGAASMSVSSSNGCQGATFNIAVTVTVHKG